MLHFSSGKSHYTLKRDQEADQEVILVHPTGTDITFRKANISLDKLPEHSFALKTSEKVFVYAPRDCTQRGALLDAFEGINYVLISDRAEALNFE